MIMRLASNVLYHFIWLVVASSALTVAHVHAADDQAGVQSLELLNSLWDAQRDEIVTARVAFRLYRGGSLSLNLSADQIFQKVERIWTDAKDEPTGPLDSALDALRADFVPVEPGKTHYWGNLIEIVVEGKKVHERWLPSVATGSEAKLDVFNGAQRVWYDPINVQFSLFEGAGTTELFSPTSLRFVPPVPLRAEGKTIEAAEKGGSIRLSVGPITLVADETSGFLHRYQIANSDTITYDRCQFGPIIYPGGIVFPSLVVESNFNRGHPYLISIYRVDRAEFNIDIPDDSFIVGAPRYKRVVDFRQGTDRPTEYMTSSPVEDVIAFADTAPPAEVVIRQLSTTNREFGGIARLLACVIAGILFLMLGIWLWRR